jgi:hypothetical protein
VTTRSSRFTTSLIATVVASSLLLATTSAHATTSADSAGPAGPGSAAQPTPGASTHRITLVTGDVAELTTSSNGQTSARLISDEPYYLGNFDGDLSLVPAAAYPLLSEGRLDQRLFNRTELVAQGYDDASSDRLPLLLSAPSTLRSAPAAPQSATLRRTLPSVGSTAVTVQKTDAKTFWDSISGPKTFKSTSVSKIWHPRHPRPVHETDRCPHRLAGRVRRQRREGRRPRHRVRRRSP